MLSMIFLQFRKGDMKQKANTHFYSQGGLIQKFRFHSFSMKLVRTSSIQYETSA